LNAKVLPLALSGGVESGQDSALAASSPPKRQKIVKNRKKVLDGTERGD